MDEAEFKEKVTELQEDDKIKQQLEQNNAKAEELLKDRKKMEDFLERLENNCNKNPIKRQKNIIYSVLIINIKEKLCNRMRKKTHLHEKRSLT